MHAREFEFVAELPDNSRTRPKKYVGSGLIKWFAAALKCRTGEWAKWPAPIRSSTAHSYSQRILRGVQPGFCDGRYEAQVRNSVLYVRYVGAGEGGSDV